MNLRQRILLALALAIGAAAHAEQEPRETVVNPGLVVESVTPNFQADLAEIQEGDVLVNGLRNFVFEKVSPDNPLRVDIYTADTADADKGINEGDIVKILVNPKK